MYGKFRSDRENTFGGIGSQLLELIIIILVFLPWWKAIIGDKKYNFDAISFKNYTLLVVTPLKMCTKLRQNTINIFLVIAPFKIILSKYFLAYRPQLLELITIIRVGRLASAAPWRRSSWKLVCHCGKWSRMCVPILTTDCGKLAISCTGIRFKVAAAQWTSLCYSWHIMVHTWGSLWLTMLASAHWFTPQGFTTEWGTDTARQCSLVHTCGGLYYRVMCQCSMVSDFWLNIFTPATCRGIWHCSPMIWWAYKPEDSEAGVIPHLSLCWHHTSLCCCLLTTPWTSTRSILSQSWRQPKSLPPFYHRSPHPLRTTGGLNIEL